MFVAGRSLSCGQYQEHSGETLAALCKQYVMSAVSSRTWTWLCVVGGTMKELSCLAHPGLGSLYSVEAELLFQREVVLHQSPLTGSVSLGVQRAPSRRKSHHLFPADLNLGVFWGQPPASGHPVDRTSFWTLWMISRWSAWRAMLQLSHGL